jgi:V8-like Glu-specific endopeptidase
LTGQNIRHPNINEYLYVVSVVRVDSHNITRYDKICIGTLVTRKDVLTAEHCLEGEELPYTAIVAGSINFRTGTRYPLFWWLTYENWLSQLRAAAEFRFNDIAMLRVSNLNFIHTNFV